MFRNFSFFLNNTAAAKPRTVGPSTTSAAKMLRRPHVARSGSLEQNPIMSYSQRRRIDERNNGLVHINDVGDIFNSHMGKLDYWRDLVTRPNQLRKVYNKVGLKQLTPAWDVVVPLLEGLVVVGNDAGGATTNKNSTISSGKTVLSTEQQRKMFRIELSLRLPLLEESLTTTCTPLLLGRLCRAMTIVAGHDDCENNNASLLRLFGEEGRGGDVLFLQSSSIRLRAMIVAALRHCEQQLLKNGSGVGEESELRQARRVALESATASALFEFLEANKSLLLLVDREEQAEEATETSSTEISKNTEVETALQLVSTVDVEKELPMLTEWCAARLRRAQ